MTSHLQGFARTLAIGYILYFWSERVFWSFWRPQDSPRDAVVTWLAYSFVAAVMLALIRGYRASSFGAVFLAGAVYGWLAEGGIVTTLYGDPTNPLPLSISWTGLAWHALLSVCLGWYWIGRALAARQRSAVLKRAAALGGFCGLWAVWWQNEADAKFSTTITAFAAHIFPFSLGFMAAWWVLGRIPAPESPPSRVGRGLLFSLTLAFLLGVRLPATPIAAVVLSPLLLLCWWGLKRGAGPPSEPNALAQTSGSFGARDCITLLALPVSACIVYTALAWTRWPTNVIVYVVTMPLGFWLLGRSLWKAARPSAAPRAPLRDSADEARPREPS